VKRLICVVSLAFPPLSRHHVNPGRASRKRGGQIVLNMTDASNALFIQTAATSMLNVTFTM
jgi:hypothetical protein